MTPECKHEYCTTKFCPNCGECVNSGPMGELAIHLKKTIAAKRYAYEKHIAYFKANNPGKEYVEGGVGRSLRKSLQKWESWLKAVMEVLDKKTHNGHRPRTHQTDRKEIEVGPFYKTTISNKSEE